MLKISLKYSRAWMRSTTGATGWIGAAGGIYAFWKARWTGAGWNGAGACKTGTC